MKFMVISDIHGSAYYLEKVLECYVKETADYLLVLGDFLYHGPRNPLPEGYDPKKVIEKLKPYQNRLVAVRGNCDGEVDQMVLTFPMLSDYSTLVLGNRRVFMHHGHHYDENKLPPLTKGDIFLQGHTHIPTVHKKDGIYILNPGSISLPKNESPNSYAILNKKSFVVKNLEGDVFSSVDFEE